MPPPQNCSRVSEGASPGAFSVRRAGGKKRGKEKRERESETLQFLKLGNRRARYFKLSSCSSYASSAGVARWMSHGGLAAHKSPPEVPVLVPVLGDLRSEVDCNWMRGNRASCDLQPLRSHPSGCWLGMLGSDPESPESPARALMPWAPRSRPAPCAKKKAASALRDCPVTGYCRVPKSREQTS